MTVSPSYQLRGVPNPFYTINKVVDSLVQRLAKNNNLTYRNNIFMYFNIFLLLIILMLSLQIFL